MILKHGPEQKQISPLRFAPVEMTEMWEHKGKQISIEGLTPPA
jgi:hypothetical protein